MKHWGRLAPLVGLGPLGLIVALRVFGGASGPSAAGGQTIELAAPPEARRALEATDAQRRLQALVEAFDRSSAGGSGGDAGEGGRAVLASPMLPPTDAEADPGLFPELPTQTATERPDPVVVVTSIVSGPRPMAIVNGALRQTGDVLDDGWVVAEIDPAAGSVTLTHPDRPRPVRAVLERR